MQVPIFNYFHGTKVLVLSKLLEDFPKLSKLAPAQVAQIRIELDWPGQRRGDICVRPDMDSLEKFDVLSREHYDLS